MLERWLVALSVASTVGCAPAPQPVAIKSVSKPSPPAVEEGKPAAAAAAEPGLRSWRSHGYEVMLHDRTGDAEHHAELEAWVERALSAVSETTGGAAEPIHVVAERGAEGATTRERTITLHLEDGPRPAQADQEWVLPHELIHASFPSLWDPDQWLEEGLATYLEPLVRVRAGQLQEREMWGDLARDLPQGAVKAGEGGLRGTREWHRLYWQGAVFWLDAELTIFEKTSGKLSLGDALCAWARQQDSDDFDSDQAFAAMDARLEQAILRPLYERASEHGLARGPAELLTALGVSVTSGGVSFKDDAPAAELRRRLARPSPRPCSH
jgi:hypothetical protein